MALNMAHGMSLKSVSGALVFKCYDGPLFLNEQHKFTGEPLLYRAE